MFLEASGRELGASTTSATTKLAMKLDMYGYSPSALQGAILAGIQTTESMYGGLGIIDIMQ
ncbi:hypothetical protein ACKS0A_06510 [Histoplasma ohiense]